MPSQSGVIDADFLVIDSAGVMRDTHVEHLYRDFYTGETDVAITHHNLCLYVSQYFPAASPPPETVLTSVDDAMHWVTHNIGAVTVWALRPPETELPNVQRDNLRYAALVGPNAGDRNSHAMARTMHHAVMLAFVQRLREQVIRFHARHNKPPPRAMQH